MDHSVTHDSKVETQRRRVEVIMFTPSASGGHARYTYELMLAIASAAKVDKEIDCNVELVAGQDLESQYTSTRYGIHKILPSLKHRTKFRTNIHWLCSRLVHYPVREHRFYLWITQRPEVRGVHFQEFTPWLAKLYFRKLRKSNVKVIATVHNVVPHAYPRLLPRFVYDNWNRKGWRNCDILLVHSSKLKEHLSSFMRGQHPPIMVVPHGAWIDPRPMSSDGSAQSLSQRMLDRRLLFFGTIRENKGLHLLLDALRLLPGFHLTIAGEVIEPHYYQREIEPRLAECLAAGMSVEVRKKFTPDDELRMLFETHSALIMPYSESFVAQSGVVFMALAYQTPIVATSAGGMADLLSSFDIGEKIASCSPEAIAESVNKLFGGRDVEELRRQLSEAAREHSWETSAVRTLDAYRSVL